MSARYDAIGRTYARTRREDPRIAARLAAALGDARSVVNVGAGTGSYEPEDREVIAIEPSAVMIAQRSTPAIQASAGSLPLDDDTADAAMALITVHHWEDELEAGLRELSRVARRRVVVLTYDADVSGQMWLMRDYLPEVAALDREIFPAPERVAAAFADAAIEVVPIARDTPDWMLGSFWAHPERVLDPVARAGTSGFARMDAAVVDRVVREVARDLESGEWDRRHGHLRSLEEYDAGLRLIVARPG